LNPTQRIRKAVLPVAGLGTRFFPATKSQPKELLPIVDKPLIQYAVEEAVASGIEVIILVTSEGKGALEDHFGSDPELERLLAERGKTEELKVVRELSRLATIQSVQQKHPQGLGHAIGCARALVGEEPFAVLLPDDVIDPSASLGTSSATPCLRQLMEVYQEYPGCVVATRAVAAADTPRYGMLGVEPVEARAEWRERLFRVTHLVEKPPASQAPSPYGIIGRYVFEPDIFACIDQTQPGCDGEIQITDSLALYARSKPVYAWRFAGTLYDVGTKLGLLRATLELGLKHPELGAAFRAYLKSLKV
jgi:UTP--glucose-1-phosphate uridylyltransferase